MACYDNEVDTSPENDREEKGNKDRNKEGGLRAYTSGNSINKECDGDVFAPLQRNTGAEQGGPYQAIPRELLCPEERQHKDIPEQYLNENDAGHNGDYHQECNLRRPINDIADPLHSGLIDEMRVKPFLVVYSFLPEYPAAFRSAADLSA